MGTQTCRQGEPGDTHDSASRMRLFSGPLSMFGAKAQIAALEKGLDFDLVMVPFDMQHLYEPKHPDVLRINPKRQVPVLIYGDLEIFEFDPDLRVFRTPAAKPCALAQPTGGQGPSALARAQIRRGLFPTHYPPDGASSEPWRAGRDRSGRGSQPLLSRNGGDPRRPRVPRRFI